MAINGGSESGLSNGGGYDFGCSSNRKTKSKLSLRPMNGGTGLRKNRSSKHDDGDDCFFNLPNDDDDDGAFLESPEPLFQFYCRNPNYKTSSDIYTRC